MIRRANVLTLKYVKNEREAQSCPSLRALMACKLRLRVTKVVPLPQDRKGRDHPRGADIKHLAIEPKITSCVCRWGRRALVPTSVANMC